MNMLKILFSKMSLLKILFSKDYDILKYKCIECNYLGLTSYAQGCSNCKSQDIVTEESFYKKTLVDKDFIKSKFTNLNIIKNEDILKFKNMIFRGIKKDSWEEHIEYFDLDTAIEKFIAIALKIDRFEYNRLFSHYYSVWIPPSIGDSGSDKKECLMITYHRDSFGTQDGESHVSVFCYFRTGLNEYAEWYYYN